MQIECMAGDLADAAAYVQRVVEPKNKNKVAILDDVLLGASGERVTLTATGFSCMARAECMAELGEAGSAAVPADRLAKLLAGLDGIVKIETVDGGVAVKSGRSRYRLPTLPPEDFPQALSAGPDACEFELAPEVVSRLFAEPVPAVCDVPTRAYLTGIFIHDSDGHLAACATDGAQLIRVVTDLPAGALPANGKHAGVIVPTAACTEIARLAKAGSVAIQIGATIIEARTRARLLCSQLIDGVFPDFERVIPKPSGRTAEVDRATLLAALARAAAVADSTRAAVILLAWERDELALDLAREPGTASDVIAATVAGKGRVTMALSPLIDLLEALDGERVQLDASAARSATRISVVGDDGLLCLRMPITLPTEDPS
jgi:DNA polymerase III subunit beta